MGVALNNEFQLSSSMRWKNKCGMGLDVVLMGQGKPEDVLCNKMRIIFYKIIVSDDVELGNKIMIEGYPLLGENYLTGNLPLSQVNKFKVWLTVLHYSTYKQLRTLQFPERKIIPHTYLLWGEKRRSLEKQHNKRIIAARHLVLADKVITLGRIRSASALFSFPLPPTREISLLKGYVSYGCNRYISLTEPRL